MLFFAYLLILHLHLSMGGFSSFLFGSMYRPQRVRYLLAPAMILKSMNTPVLLLNFGNFQRIEELNETNDI